MTSARFGRISQSVFFVPVVLLFLALGVFGDLLFGSSARVVSSAHNDAFTQFYFWRSFGFDAIRQGVFPLWNPHVFSGTPFFGNFQPALLYPVNWVHLIFPTGRAISIEVFLNVYLTGLGMYLWARHTELRRVACLVGAALWMFGAPYFLKITAGHLAPLGAMCWIPWVLLAVDKLFNRQYRAGSLLGTFVGAMMLLAGHPQTAYTTAIAVTCYAVLRMFSTRDTPRVGLCLLLIGAGVCALSAVQLGAGWAVAGESARTSSVPMDFVKTFAQPPENFLTLIAPYFFSGAYGQKYWGRAYMWEVSLFMGVVGFLLAAHGVWSRPRESWLIWLPVVILWLLAISPYTPLFEIFYKYLPGFSKFRGHSKFTIPAAAFLAMAAAIGMDQLLGSQEKEDRKKLLFTFATLLFFVVTGLVGTQLYSSSPAWFAQLLLHVESTHESYMPSVVFRHPDFVRDSAKVAGISLLTCSGLALLSASLLWGSRFSRHFLLALAILVIVEMAYFARANRPSFEIAEIQRFVDMYAVADTGDDRFLGVDALNAAIGARSQDIWGYDPVVLGRYIRFMAWSQGSNTDEINSSKVVFKGYNRLYSMLRCRFINVVGEDRKKQVGELPPPLPHALLLNHYSVIADRDAIFAAMKKQGFDPARELILETEPVIKPAAGGVRGKARIVESSLNYLIIEAETDRPTILLVTDSYSRDWKAWGLDGSVQQKYEIQPANTILRAIPLQAGKHTLRMQYMPRGFILAKWVSLTAWIVYLGCLGFWFKRKRSSLKR